MRTLDFDENNPIRSTRGFWRRQFQREPTSSQKKFDWIFGVVMPVACFFFDPILFSDPFAAKGSHSAHGMLVDYRIAVYILTYVSTMGMLAWLLWREKLRWLNSFLSGLFVAGSLVALGIGIFLFPISLICSLFGIGVFGFTPLVTSLIYARNAVRSFRVARKFLGSKVAFDVMVLAGMFALVVPYVTNIVMSDRSPDLWKVISQTYGWML